MASRSIKGGEDVDYNYPGIRVERAEGRAEEVVLLFKKSCQEQGWDCSGFFEQYAPIGKFWGAYDRETDLLVGAIMVLERSDGELPVSKHWPQLADEINESSCELAMVAIDRAYRGARRLFMPLYYAFFMQCKLSGIETAYAILNEVGFQLLHRIGIAFVKVGEIKPIWGDPSYPFRLSVSGLEADLRQNRPDVWAAVEHFIAENENR